MTNVSKRKSKPVGSHVREPVELAVWRKLHSRLIATDGSYEGPGYVCDGSLIKRQQFNPHVFVDARSASAYYCVSSFLKKWKGHKHVTAEGRLRASLGSWVAAESRCAETNRRLESECFNGVFTVAPDVLFRAQRKIARILGRCDVDECLLRSKFSSGATYNTKRGTTLDEKLTVHRKAITRGAIPLWERFLELVPGVRHQFEGELEIVRGDKLIFVDKDATIDRGINPSPLLNGFLSQGFGRMIRHRLKCHGVDLNDQSVNQRLAFSALADGLATIDLSQASDTMSRALVKLLLVYADPPWLECLEALRSPVTMIGDRAVHLQKFSAMGCAFTFELESLIFFALCASACEEGETVSVYGDDIVVPTIRFDKCVSTLNWAGFTINTEKSYAAPSRFYESCGRHYFDLEDITPIYQKDVCHNVADYVRLHNRLVRFGLRCNRLTQIWAICRYVRDRIRTDFNCEVDYGPVVTDDRWLIDPKCEPVGRRIRMLVPVKRREAPVRGPGEHALCAYKLYNPSYANSSGRGYAARIDADVRYVVRHKHMSAFGQTQSGPASGWLPS